MSDETWRRALAAAQDALRERSPDGWCPPTTHIAAALTEALRVIQVELLTTSERSDQ